MLLLIKILSETKEIRLRSLRGRVDFKAGKSNQQNGEQELHKRAAGIFKKLNRRMLIKKTKDELLQFLDSDVIEQNLTLLARMDLQGKKAIEELIIFPMSGRHSINPSFHNFAFGMNGEAIPLPYLTGSTNLFVFL